MAQVPDTSFAVVSKNDECCIKNEDFFIKHGDFCIKYDEFCRAWDATGASFEQACKEGVEGLH